VVAAHATANVVAFTVTLVVASRFWSAHSALLPSPDGGEL
jgi:hypothetical protein